MPTNPRIILHNRLKGRAQADYIMIEQTGLDHSPTFKYDVQVNGTTLGTGSGPNQDAAMEEAARDAVERGDKTGVFRKL